MRAGNKFRSSTVVVAGVVALTIGVLALALAATGCGDSTTTASPTPVASPTEATTAQKIAEYTAYFQQVKPVYDEITAAAMSLDGAVQDLSKKPDDTWTASAKQMSSASDQLASATMTLEGITPPAGLQSTQDAVVGALKDARSVLDTTAAYLDKRVADPNMPDVKTTIENEVKAKLTAALQAAVADVMAGMGGSSDMPMASPSATP